MDELDTRFDRFSLGGYCVFSRCITRIAWREYQRSKMYHSACMDGTRLLDLMWCFVSEPDSISSQQNRTLFPSSKFMPVNSITLSSGGLPLYHVGLLIRGWDNACVHFFNHVALLNK
jgi:hypothetical protein